MDENIYEDTTRCNSDKDPESNSDNDSKSEIDYGDMNAIQEITQMGAGRCGLVFDERMCAHEDPFDDTHPEQVRSNSYQIYALFILPLFFPVLFLFFVFHMLFFFFVLRFRSLFSSNFPPSKIYPSRFELSCSLLENRKNLHHRRTFRFYEIYVFEYSFAILLAAGSDPPYFCAAPGTRACGPLHAHSGKCPYQLMGLEILIPASQSFSLKRTRIIIHLLLPHQLIHFWSRTP